MRAQVDPVHDRLEKCLEQHMIEADVPRVEPLVLDYHPYVVRFRCPEKRSDYTEQHGKKLVNECALLIIFGASGIDICFSFLANCEQDDTGYHHADTNYI